MPLLCGVMGAGAEEKSSRVAADFFWAAVWETYFCDGFQTQLGLEVNQLTAQLQQNTRKMRWCDSLAHTGSQVSTPKKELPSRISTESCCWLDAAQGTKITPPALHGCRNTKPPLDPTVFQILSSAHNAATNQKNYFTPGWMNGYYFDAHNDVHGYLAASSAARCRVHDPTLQALPSGAVGTAGCSHIVQLQRGRDSSC